MAKITKKLSIKYTTVDTNVLTDTLLSYKAKGIYSYLISRPDNWDYNMTNIINTSTDGRESVQAGIKELERYKNGLLKRIRSHNNYGKFAGWNWEIYDTYTMLPIDGFSVSRENRLSEKPSDGKSAARNKEFKKNDLNNLSLERVDFKTFKKQLIKFCPNYEFKLKEQNGQKLLDSHLGFCLKNGYIYNQQIGDFCVPNESFKIWQYLYDKRLQVFEQATIQNNNKSIS